MAAEAVGTVRGTVRCRCVLLSVLALLLTAVEVTSPIFEIVDAEIGVNRDRAPNHPPARADGGTT